jgi:hypothetical protein
MQGGRAKTKQQMRDGRAKKCKVAEQKLNNKCEMVEQKNTRWSSKKCNNQYVVRIKIRLIVRVMLFNRKLARWALDPVVARTPVLVRRF